MLWGVRRRTRGKETHTHTHTDGKTEKHLPKYRAKAPWEAKGVLCPVVRDTTQRSLWVTA